MENESAAFGCAIRPHMREIRRALGQDPVMSATLSCAEQIQYEG